ncbi:MAG: hypothetical protein M1825_001901 [Sarcosagium campestre]|nr:MAG: hypothetical protein M1825_001901 [Sarcosagium campestre]
MSPSMNALPVENIFDINSNKAKVEMYQKTELTKLFRLKALQESFKSWVLNLSEDADASDGCRFYIQSRVLVLSGKDWRQHTALKRKADDEVDDDDATSSLKKVRFNPSGSTYEIPRPSVPRDLKNQSTQTAPFNPPVSSSQQSPVPLPPKSATPSMMSRATSTSSPEKPPAPPSTFSTQPAASPEKPPTSLFASQTPASPAKQPTSIFSAQAPASLMSRAEPAHSPEKPSVPQSIFNSQPAMSPSKPLSSLFSPQPTPDQTKVHTTPIPPPTQTLPSPSETFASPSISQQRPLSETSSVLTKLFNSPQPPTEAKPISSSLFGVPVTTLSETSTNSSSFAAPSSTATGTTSATSIFSAPSDASMGKPSNSSIFGAASGSETDKASNPSFGAIANVSTDKRAAPPSIFSFGAGKENRLTPSSDAAGPGASPAKPLSSLFGAPATAAAGISSTSSSLFHKAQPAAQPAAAAPENPSASSAQFQQGTPSIFSSSLQSGTPSDKPQAPAFSFGSGLSATPLKSPAPSIFGSKPTTTSDKPQAPLFSFNPQPNQTQPAPSSSIFSFTAKPAASTDKSSTPPFVFGSKTTPESDKPSPALSSLFGPQPTTTSTASTQQEEPKKSASLFSRITRDDPPKPAVQAPLKGPGPSPLRNSVFSGSVLNQAPVPTSTNIFGHLAPPASSFGQSETDADSTEEEPNDSGPGKATTMAAKPTNTSTPNENGVGKSSTEQQPAEADEDDSTPPPSAEDPSTDLAAGGPGEEGEETLFEVRAKAVTKDPETKQDKMQGLGPLRVRRNRDTGVTRVLMRQEKTGRVVLNTNIIKGTKYHFNKTFVMLPVLSRDANAKLTTWWIRVKTADQARDLAAVLDESSSAAGSAAAGSPAPASPAAADSPS